MCLTRAPSCRLHAADSTKTDVHSEDIFLFVKSFLISALGTRDALPPANSTGICTQACDDLSEIRRAVQRKQDGDPGAEGQEQHVAAKTKGKT